MSPARLPNGPVDWDAIRLVVFDLDGTLYDQRRLRAAMMLRLLWHAAATRSLDVIRVLHAFRQWREKLGAMQSADFLTEQYAMIARRTGYPADAVKAIVEEWMEIRPLDVLPPCRYRYVKRLFSGLAAQGKILAVLSDYPAQAKLRALELDANIVVWAGDAGVGALKPNPAGLQQVLDSAKVPASQALMIGDRVDRDWAVAQKLGMRALIRSRRSIRTVDTFRDFGDDVFGAVMRPEEGSPSESRWTPVPAGIGGSRRDFPSAGH